MILPLPSRNQLTAIHVGSCVALGYGLLFARRRSARKKVAIVAGVAGVVYSAVAWKQKDAEDAAVTRNPEVMNGHFLTDGRASAVTGGLADVGYLRELMGVPTRAARR